MTRHRCPAHCLSCMSISRREFVTATTAAMVSTSLLRMGVAGPSPIAASQMRQCGPASQCTPTVKACFVRRKGEYGMRWPGQIYDGEAARKTYTEKVQATAKQLGIKLDLRAEPIYSSAQADAWLAEAQQTPPDGLLVMLLDRQEHAWPTANKAVDTKIPTVVFAPLGAAFTTNTVSLAHKTGCLISCTNDFRQVEYGMKMLHAGTKMHATRCLVIAGKKRRAAEIPGVGVKLQYIPASDFLELYQKTPVDDRIRGMAADLVKHASKVAGPTQQDVINGIKSYVVAEQLLQREKCDAITMDCLGALGRTKVSLPCIAWSRMNDDGIPAACEADLGAVATHTIVQYLFDRPGFQQDPVPETVQDTIIGAHCTCATRLNGFQAPAEPYDIVPHHGQRDATRRTVWKIGQRITTADVLPGNEAEPAQMIISSGTVIENLSAPPRGGCVVSVMVKLDGVTDVLAYPGFHQLFFYGDYKKQLTEFCNLYNIKPVVV